MLGKKETATIGRIGKHFQLVDPLNKSDATSENLLSNFKSKSLIELKYFGYLLNNSYKIN